MELVESYFLENDFIKVVLLFGIGFSLIELFVLVFLKKRAAIFESGFFYNISSGIFIMTAFFSYIFEYFVLCISLFFLSGVLHFMALKILLKI